MKLGVNEPRQPLREASLTLNVSDFPLGLATVNISLVLATDLMPKFVYGNT
jgi:hypothetical protein